MIKGIEKCKRIPTNGAIITFFSCNVTAFTNICFLITVLNLKEGKNYTY